ncbi:uncharacterized protein E0L32_011133 [Thyridium curvatum]|uniref:Uncharacterized protein n=1 Tax=Thyridium curvatum TaxID=1093900 RepID=A0A507AQ50_9PEZI|nr:uncharacterized protein E0L32_011133 [Thyridium curvatum]TPX06988.1 hypothetical protein E0L32_011133 [Thyridium curvatum]
MALSPFRKRVREGVCRNGSPSKVQSHFRFRLSKQLFGLPATGSTSTMVSEGNQDGGLVRHLGCASGSSLVRLRPLRTQSSGFLAELRSTEAGLRLVPEREYSGCGRSAIAQTLGMGKPQNSVGVTGIPSRLRHRNSDLSCLEASSALASGLADLHQLLHTDSLERHATVSSRADYHITPCLAHTDADSGPSVPFRITPSRPSLPSLAAFETTEARSSNDDC